MDTELCETYFHLVPHSDRIRKKDFRSYYDRGLEKELEETEGCGRRSVSVHKDKADLHRILKLYPTKRERCIVRVELRGGHGVVMHTPSEEGGPTHHDWWIPIGVNPCDFADKTAEGPFP